LPVYVLRLFGCSHRCHQSGNSRGAIEEYRNHGWEGALPPAITPTICFACSLGPTVSPGWEKARFYAGFNFCDESVIHQAGTKVKVRLIRFPGSKDRSAELN